MIRNDFCDLLQVTVFHRFTHECEGFDIVFTGIDLIASLETNMRSSNFLDYSHRCDVIKKKERKV